MLNVQTEHQENHTVRLTVDVDAERLERAMRDAARRISKKARIHGFRPGKAPFEIVVNLYGREYVLGEALDRLGNEIYREALDATDIEPYAPGSLEDVNEDEGLKLTFVVPKRPEVDLGDYRSIREEYEVEEVTDEMVDDAMEELREGQAVIEDVERPAEMDDQVTMGHFEAVLVSDDDEDEDEESEAEDDTDAEAADEAESDDADESDDDDDLEDEDDDEEVLIHQHDYVRVLRDDDKDLFPGFSKELVGLSAGDEKTFTLDIPDDYDMEDIAGRTVRCEVNVEKVQARTVPEWTDELAKRISQNDEVETIVELRMDVRKRLEEAAERNADQELIEEALTDLVEGATIHYPEELVQEYVDDILAELDSNMRQQGLTLDDFIRITGRDKESLRAEYRDRAVWRAERALALGELVKSEELGVSEDDVLDEIDRISTMLAGDQAGQFKQFLMTDESRADISNRMVSDRALSRLAAIAKGEEPPIGPEPVAEAEPETAAEDAESEVESEEASDEAPEAAEAAPVAEVEAADADTTSDAADADEPNDE